MFTFTRVEEFRATSSLGRFSLALGGTGNGREKRPGDEVGVSGTFCAACASSFYIIRSQCHNTASFAGFSNNNSLNSPGKREDHSFTLNLNETISLGLGSYPGG